MRTGSDHHIHAVERIEGDIVDVLKALGRRDLDEWQEDSLRQRLELLKRQRRDHLCWYSESLRIEWIERDYIELRNRNTIDTRDADSHFSSLAQSTWLRDAPSYLLAFRPFSEMASFGMFDHD